MSTARAKPLDQRFQQFKLARTGASGDCPRLVDYILLAEFDIDTGSTLRHKYPGPVPGYRDDWFAEYMLPEGAHNHSLDWTVMFLNKASRRAALADEGDGEAGGADPAPPAAGASTLEDDLLARAGVAASLDAMRDAPDEEAVEEAAAAGRAECLGSADGSAAAAAAEPEPFLYCINLVRKKDDPTVRRGAVVKAMAVCSRHHFIEMFRPLLIIALDAYYQSTDPAVLAGLYAAINAADAAALPRPLAWERRVMRRGVAGRALGGVAQQHLPQKWTHTMTFEYGTQKQHLPHKWTHTATFEYGTQKLRARARCCRPEHCMSCVHTAIPLHSTPDETLTPSVTLLFTVFGAAAMRIYNAVITGQRVLFVGYNHAAGDVGKLVLAACAMVAPPLRGIVRRTFPYANLSDLAFLETPAYIAGVTNPMFESHTSWWDLLCQLDLPNGTGTALTADEKAALDDQKGKKSPPRPPASARRSEGQEEPAAPAGKKAVLDDQKGKKSPPRPPARRQRAPLDDQKGKKSPPRPPARVSAEQLTCEDDAAFAARLLAGISAGMSEQWVRATLRDHTQGLVDLAVDQGLVDHAVEQGLVDRAVDQGLVDLAMDQGLADVAGGQAASCRLPLARSERLLASRVTFASSTPVFNDHAPASGADPLGCAGRQPMTAHAAPPYDAALAPPPPMLSGRGAAGAAGLDGDHFCDTVLLAPQVSLAATFGDTGLLAPQVSLAAAAVAGAAAAADGPLDVGLAPMSPNTLPQSATKSHPSNKWRLRELKQPRMLLGDVSINKAGQADAARLPRSAVPRPYSTVAYFRVSGADCLYETAGECDCLQGRAPPQRLGRRRRVPTILPDFPGPQTTDPWRYMELAGGISGAQLRRHVRRLTLADGGGLDDQEVKEIFRDLDTALQSEASLQVLLGLMPESKGGIFVLGCGLMHGSAEVRAHALSLHRRLNAFESTRPAIYAMNDLLAMTYMRNE
ncbi:docking domain of Afi1 for Arf3 in vesicle trafficking-domain-containing protein [Tribonema minus]|uniref:Docking domain of Afi1 for Arf3 in vesicle trafficking-domain-containing protein n=1 Tax=Tribonema minus TaxID=303371 RepID=A0A836CED8_9STRA|nr:docking domain of Afi1 for Arf3 in vesicle trafficking-domain-containing protein [Tribonema minus]